LGVILLGLLATARSLTPDARGFGTHEQLGLTPCSFYRWTGWQCPTCGATTAWSHALRGDWSAAANANLAAAVACPFAVTLAGWCLASAIVGRFLLISPTLRVWLVIGSVLVAIALLDWIRRVLISP
jgi:hypothetical protein